MPLAPAACTAYDALVAQVASAAANEEAIRAWDGPLFDRFVRFRHLLTSGLGAHGEEALRLASPRPGARVLDIGCGFGDTAQRIAGLVGASGAVLGVDASPGSSSWRARRPSR